MKIRKEFIDASRAIRQISKEMCVSSVYVWDIAEEQFNIIKGCGCVINQQEIDILLDIIKRENEITT